MSTTTTASVRNARALLDAEQFAGVTATVIDNNIGMDQTLAERIVDQALAFLATRVAHPEAAIAPSPVVDEGWHALVLDTRLYAELCSRLGAFVHHRPERPEPSGYDGGIIARTMSAIRAEGYVLDTELWQGPTTSTICVAAHTWHTPPPGPIVIIPKPKPKPKPNGPSAE